MKISKILVPILLFTLLCTACGAASEPPRLHEADPLSPESGQVPTAVLAEPTDEPESEPESEESAPGDEIDAIISDMSVEEMVGQLFLARNPSSEEDTLRLINELKLGGLIFFARDFRNSSPEKFSDFIEKCTDEAPFGLFTAVDEEGGTVQRIGLYEAFADTPFRSPMELYDEGGLEAVLADTDEKCALLKSLGINLNLAPVADVSTCEEDFIYLRTLGKDATETAAYVAAVTERMSENGIMSALKHFPGYGNNADTHTGVANDRRTEESFFESDLLPFISGIEAGAPIVLVSHNIVHCFDPENPASLSEKVISVLRNELAFDGVVMTDDLSMGALKDISNENDPAVLALLAGCDLLCSSDAEEQYKAVLDAVKSGVITEERLKISVKRILEAKMRYGIFVPGQTEKECLS